MHVNTEELKICVENQISNHLFGAFWTFQNTFKVGSDSEPTLKPIIFSENTRLLPLKCLIF